MTVYESETSSVPPLLIVDSDGREWRAIERPFSTSHSFTLACGKRTATLFARRGSSLWKLLTVSGKRLAVAELITSLPQFADAVIQDNGNIRAVGA